MTDLVRVRRALVSVSDKTGVVELARGLQAFGVQIISTGGTAKALADAGIAVIPIESVTGFPEMMDGRVKTLHPAIHGGLLGLREHPEHVRAMQQHGITPIDLVCVNLYPFEKTVARPGVSLEEAIENIDIGGPSMIRSAAKNAESVAVVTDPSQYRAVLDQLRANDGATSMALRRSLAAAAYARTSAYDAAITAFLEAREGDATPTSLRIAAERVQSLRYGENPHQRAALYATASDGSTSLVGARQLHGKELSYNNLNDAAAALNLALDLSRITPNGASAVVVKHTNPCGGATAGDVASAIRLALDGDRVAAYGGILVASRPIDAEAAAHLVAQDVFLEVIVAPSFDERALDRLRARSANVRLLEVGAFVAPANPPLTLRTIPGGILAQEADSAVADTSTWQHHAGPAPTPERLAHAATVWTICKHLTSNAVAIGGPADSGVALFGAGAGQMDRVNSCRIAAEKAGARAGGAIAASDAFFPFADGPKVLIDAGVTMLVHTGGSKRDQETFDLCRDRGVTCLTTGVRHFRH